MANRKATPRIPRRTLSRYKAPRRYGPRNRKNRFTERRPIGFPVNSATTKRHVVNVIRQDFDTRTLYMSELTAIERQSGVHELNRRERDVVNISGFKIMAECRNLNSEPLQVSFAVLSRIDSTIPSSTEFFRGDGSGDRTMNLGTNRTSLEQMNAPINTDDYIILWRQNLKFSVTQETTTNWQNDIDPSYGTIKKWIPLNRQIRFNATGDANERIYLVWWCDKFNQMGASPIDPASFQSQMRLETFFKDVC